MIDRLRFAGTVLIVAVCTVMTMTAITRAFSILPVILIKP